MKTSIIAVALTTLAGLASANPVEKRSDVTVTFLGAADASFSQNFPVDGSTIRIYNPLSISKIYSPGGAQCTFTGVDGAVTVVNNAGTVDVGPPQTQVRGTCKSL